MAESDTVTEREGNVLGAQDGEKGVDVQDGKEEEFQPLKDPHFKYLGMSTMTTMCFTSRGRARLKK